METGYREAGYSLTETIVALALVLTVVLPLSSLAVHLTGRRLGEEERTALALGQRMMEETLQRQRYVDEEQWMEDRRWRVRRRVRPAGRDAVVIRVEVFRGDRPEPSLELVTVRLRP